MNTINIPQNEGKSKLIERIEAVYVGKYDLSLADFREIARAAGNSDSVMDVIYLGYRYGFMRGMRKGKKDAEQEKSGGQNNGNK